SIRYSDRGGTRKLPSMLGNCSELVSLKKLHEAVSLFKNISSEYDRLRVANSVDYSQRVKKKSEAGRAAWEVAYDEIEGQ
ncbi:18155_t:CDS:2, partial [Rhizophagus irregularis]